MYNSEFSVKSVRIAITNIRKLKMKIVITIMCVCLAVALVTARDNTENKRQNSPACVCPRIYDPVCATDKKTYANRCEFACMQRTRTTLRIDHAGVCSESLDTLVELDGDGEVVLE